MEPAGHRAGKGGKATASRARFRVVQRPFQGANSARARGRQPSHYNIWSLRSARRRQIAAQPAEADQRKMPERRHRAALDDLDAAVARGPLRQALPAEFRPPAEPARQRREALLEDGARAGLGAKVVDQNDLAAGPEHADELVERRLRI